MRSHDVRLHYRGLKAVDGVTLALARGSIHALIGANGAGKSTLVGLLSGEYWPSDGRVELDGVDVTDWRQPRRARAGVSRSYQHSSVFGQRSALENCRLCAQARGAGLAHWLGSAAACRASARAAQAALERVGLGGLDERPAASLSHGSRRQLELAMCLACEPRILLLDEPLAGMGSDETEGMLALLRSLRREHAILMVEHDMDAVFRIADEITVMADGRVLASGPPSLISADARVRRSYLGEDRA